MSVFQSFTSYPNENPITIKPRIPYFGTIPTLTAGALITIYGRVPFGCRRFEFNLMVGSLITEQLKNSGDIAFHFNPRFDERVVVRNSRQNDRWVREERDPKWLPFIAGQDFQAMILVEEKGYKVAINGKHFIEFGHRIPISCIGVLCIDGNVDIDRIEYLREMRYLQTSNPMPNTINPSLGSTLQPIFNPSVPYEQRFSSGLREGFMFYISGRPLQSPQVFTINFLSGALSVPEPDIVFHLDVRIKEQSVVRNSRQSGQWGHEERHIPEFPFYAGVNFDLIIRIESNGYMVAVNGQHFLEFKHRMPVQSVNRMEIIGDVVITSIRFAQT